MDVQTLYGLALAFAARKHAASGETVKGTDLPYIVHVCNVAMEILVADARTAEFNLPLAVQVALLHDTVEDTDTKIEDIEKLFGKEVATGVEALTKNEALPQNEQIYDSVCRIKTLQKEIWAIKLADRIANLQPPPADWDKERIEQYFEDSNMILSELREGNKYLADRLKDKIEEYKSYL